jgi:cytochrome c553
MRRLLLLLFVAVLVAAAWVMALPPVALAQPVAFNHAKHAPAGCVLCHEGAQGTTGGARAGIPQADVCIRCHATAPARGVSESAWNDIAAGKTIAWRQVTRVPDHVAFSHRRHTGPANLACASCHGDMRQRTDPPGRPASRIAMTTCLDCHRREGASEDCAGCHR